MIDMQKTGQRIKEICDNQGITVRQIQDELNIGSFQSIYSWFHGKTLPSLDNFYALCKLLHVSKDSMIVEQEVCDGVVLPVCLIDHNLQILARFQGYAKKYTGI